MPRFYPRARVIISVLLEKLDGGENDEVHTFEVRPRSVEWTADHYRSADQARVQLDYRDFPIDPRSLRSVAITIHCADAGAPQQELSLTRDTLRFIGFVDQPETILSEDGEVVSFEARDYTALLLDYRWAGGAIGVDRPLSDVVAAVLAATPGCAGIQVSYSSDAAGLRLSKLMGRTIYAPRDGDDAWTILVELCGRAGLLPVFRLDTLYIEPARQFQARSVRFIYGRNVSRLMFRRAFNEVRQLQIKVRCWNEATRKVIEATYPEKPIVLKKRIGAKGKVSTENAPLAAFYVSGDYSEAQLKDVAESVYEEQAREQFSGELDTMELADLDGVDLTGLANGDQLQVRLGRQDQASIAAMSPSEARAHLVAPPSSLNPAVAEALVASWSRVEAQSAAFYVKVARHSWDRDGGYKLSVEFINYVGA